MNDKTDFTQGSILKKLALFMLPILGALVLQAAYGAVDLLVVGRFGSTAGLSGVSTGSQVLNLVTFVVIQLSMGITVLIARYLGEKKQKQIGAVLGGGAIVFTILALVLLVILVCFARPISILMQAPPEALTATTGYVRICGFGILFIVAYNLLAAIFRGLGDSRSPMYFIAIACVVNIVLDYVFMGRMQMGPAGAALGTTLAQTVSVVVALFYMKGRKTGISLKRQDFIPRRKVMGELLKVGVPVAVQDGCIQVAFMIITVIANHRGITDAAAVGIVEKVISALFIVPSSMLAAVSALSAQNIGAGKPERAEKTLKYATMITTVYGIIVTVIIEIAAEAVLTMFTKDSGVIVMGSRYIRGYIFDCIFAGIHFSFTGYFCAYGKSYIGFIHNMAAIVLVRVPGSYLASRMFADTLLPMGLAAPAGSFLSVIICVAAFIWLKNSGKLDTQKI